MSDMRNCKHCGSAFSIARRAPPAIFCSTPCYIAHRFPKRKCEAPECERTDRIVRGLCHMHRSRVARTGSVHGSFRTPVERFWSMVNKTDVCWEWQGSKRDGYGLFKADKNTSMRNAHRFSWELARGPIPAGLQVLHRCDNPACVNTDHLFLGTIADNMRDRNEKGRQARGEVAGRATLTTETVKAIRALAPIGRAPRGYLKRVAKQFGVPDRQTVRNIWRRRTWRHL